MKIHFGITQILYPQKPTQTKNAPSFGINATETNKLSCDIDRYQSTMSIFPEYADFFLKNVATVRTKGPKTILDVGSNQGELTRLVRKNFPKIKTINLEILPQMNKIAKAKDKEAKMERNVSYRIGNAMKLPVQDNSLDAIMFSRVLHEIYSYDCDKLNIEKFSLDAIEKTFEEAKNKLKPRGRVFIKDPAKPDDYNKLVVISDFKDGFNLPLPSKKELLESDVTTLGEENLLQRFLHEFEPAKGHYFSLPGKYIMPKWLASEFVRHRKFNDTKLHWQDEINEQYGVMTNKEYKKLAQKSGFKIIKAEHNFKPDENNFYAINGAFKLSDPLGNALEQEKELPVDQYLILEKK